MAYDIFNAVIRILNEEPIPQGLNHTHMVLIPKKQDPKEVSKFRPTSLCNVLYKLIAKVVTNRLKNILPFIISKNQSAFTPGHFITDNLVVAFENFHSMNGNNVSDGYMALKLDMAKVYDKVKWSFLRNIKLQLGCRCSWVEIVVSFVQSTTYSFVINGELCGLVTPSRAIRQGDPISPYLFLFCAEGLSALLCEAVMSRAIHRYPICQRASTTRLFSTRLTKKKQKLPATFCSHVGPASERHEDCSFFQ